MRILDEDKQAAILLDADQREVRVGPPAPDGDPAPFIVLNATKREIRLAPEGPGTAPKLTVTRESPESRADVQGNNITLTRPGHSLSALTSSKLDLSQEAPARRVLITPAGFRQLDASQQERVRIDHNARLMLRDSSHNPRVDLRGASGELRMSDAGGQEVLSARSVSGADLKLNNSNGQNTIRLLARDATIRAGTTGNDGRLWVRNQNNRIVAQVESDRDGADLKLNNSNGQNTIRLVARDATIRAGTTGNDGRLWVRNQNNRIVAQVESDRDGADLKLNNSNGQNTIRLLAKDAAIRAGGNGRHGRIFVRNAAGQITVSMEGSTGDLRLMGADCAEEFFTDAPDVEPGTVMVIGDEEDLLRVSCAAYDRRVAGVVSGAGSYRPGVVLDSCRTPDRGPRAAIALVGKVFCKVDTSAGPVDVGDLLTTSEVAGHAMKATDPLRAFGAILGKALRPLERGQGLVPVLVSLQ